MSKKKLFVLLLFGISILFIIYFLNHNQKLITHITDSEEFKIEYESLNNKEISDNKQLLEIKINSNNKIKYTNVSEIEYFILSNRSMVLYIGTADCPYCRSIAKTITDITINTELDNVYYLKNDPNIENYNKLLELFGNKFIETIDNKTILKNGVIFIVDGDIIGYQFNTVYSHTNPFEPMDEWQEKGLKSIYINGINYVIESNKNHNVENTP